MVASLLPKDVNVNVRPLDDLSDEQLLMRLRVLTKQAAPLWPELLRMVRTTASPAAPVLSSPGGTPRGTPFEPMGPSDAETPVLS
jgi:hypothetical protein